MVNVTWNDAIAFCKWLSKQEGREYRLPTEAEWEYACRAGTLTRYNSCDTAASLSGNWNFQDTEFEKKFQKADFKSYPSLPFSDGFAFTSPAGRLRPNGFGLVDMHGNVWEWCNDLYDEKYYASSPSTDPPGTKEGSSRVDRGGSWNDDAAHVRSSYRDHYALQGPGWMHRAPSLVVLPSDNFTPRSSNLGFCVASSSVQ